MTREDAMRLYRETGSLRGVAAATGQTVWAVRRQFRELEVPLNP